MRRTQPDEWVERVGASGRGRLRAEGGAICYICVRTCPCVRVALRRWVVLREAVPYLAGGATGTQRHVSELVWAVWTRRRHAVHNAAFLQPAPQAAVLRKGGSVDVPRPVVALHRLAAPG